jgi:hypothetical protein
VKRPKPPDLQALSSLTSFGGNQRDDVIYGALTATFVTGWGDTFTYHDVNPQNYFPVGVVLSTEDPDWEGKLRLAVKDQKVNLAQSLAEYKQTQDMFVKNAKTIWQFGRWLRRGSGTNPFAGNANRVKKPKKLRSEVSDRYLEYQFGVKPLIQDIVGSVEELEQVCSRPHYRSISSRAVNEGRLEETGVLSIDGRTLKRISTDKIVIKAKATVLGESLSAQRLGFTNPLALAWELLPYSFVVDYFIGVGNWLNAFDAMIGIQQCYGTVTRKRKYICTTNLGGYYLQEYWSRTVFESLPGSRPLPQWKPSLGFTRITNILALLSQLKR